MKIKLCVATIMKAAVVLIFKELEMTILDFVWFACFLRLFLGFAQIALNVYPLALLQSPASNYKSLNDCS